MRPCRRVGVNSCTKPRGTIAESPSRHGRMGAMTEPGDLPDDKLAERARQLRGLALRGDRYARLPAHEHESELRRRLGRATSPAPIASAPAARSFWRFW